MNSKYYEIEAKMEELIEGTILLYFEESLDSRKDCLIALEMLVEQLTDLDTAVFKNFYDN